MKTHTDQGILQAFLLSQNKSHKPLKVAAVKNYSTSVFIIDTTCFDESFFISCDNCNQFFTQINCYPEGWCNCPVTTFFQTSVLREVCILCPLSLQ